MHRGYGLKLSLLAALGLPVACGATTTRSPGDEGTAGSGIDTGMGGGGSVTHPPGTAGSRPRGGGGTTSRGGASSGGTSSGGGAGAGYACSNPKVEASGQVWCAEGYWHRPTAVACEAVGGAPAEAVGGAGGDAPTGPKPRADGSNCELDSDCSQFELGFCNSDDPFESVCDSGCITDADCGRPGLICTCTGPSGHGGECKPANCTQDSDCGEGSVCASYFGICGGGGFVCLRATEDECSSNADCGDRGTCTMDGGVRRCDDSVCGRPFLVENKIRYAPALHDSSWLDESTPAPSVRGLSRSERAAATEHWTRMGQMEHASIAAFARFSLQLLALGAPPELVEGCTAALADETAHAKLCFALASCYAGHDIGPGPLDISNSLTTPTLAGVVDLVLAEGCFGETSAALEALELADAATDPVIVEAYSRIARDEQRHAELAFRFVCWALERDPLVAERVHNALVNGPIVSAAVQDVVESCLYGVLSRRYAA